MERFLTTVSHHFQLKSSTSPQAPTLYAPSSDFRSAIRRQSDQAYIKMCTMVRCDATTTHPTTHPTHPTQGPQPCACRHDTDLTRRTPRGLGSCVGPSLDAACTRTHERSIMPRGERRNRPWTRTHLGALHGPPPGSRGGHWVPRHPTTRLGAAHDVHPTTGADGGAGLIEFVAEHPFDARLAGEVPILGVAAREHNFGSI